MDTNELLTSLRNLHEQLPQTESIDAETAELLRTVSEDIRSKLEGKDEHAQDATEPLEPRLHDLLARLEVDHPQLFGMFQRISDGLSNLGI